MTGGVFVLRDDGRSLVEMKGAEFSNESDFQKLLIDFPQLLVGKQIDSGEPRRWMLVAREQGIPEESGGVRWSVDHLFLDQSGIPTLVEVKRQSDSSIRREVVAQMLDYAANAVAYLSVEDMRAKFQATCMQSGKDPDEVVSSLIGPDQSMESYWQAVKLNLQAGRIRMLFVADRIPAELRRIVEFLNQQMDPAEVLALELRLFEGEGLRTVVPQVFCQTEEAQSRKQTRAANGTRIWDEQAFFGAMQSRGELEVHVARQIYNWMKGHADAVSFGRGKNGSISAIYTRAETRLNAFTVYTTGKLMVNFGYFNKLAFEDIHKRRELVARLNAIPGISLDAGPNVNSYPVIPLDKFADGSIAAGFFAAMEWFEGELPRQ